MTPKEPNQVNKQKLPTNVARGRATPTIPKYAHYVLLFYFFSFLSYYLSYTFIDLIFRASLLEREIGLQEIPRSILQKLITQLGKAYFCVKFFHDFINNAIYENLNKNPVHSFLPFTKNLFMVDETLI